MTSNPYPAKTNWASNLIPKANEKLSFKVSFSEIRTLNTIGIILRFGSNLREIDSF